MRTKEFLQALDDEAIARAIGEAEKRTSGEIRVFVSEQLVEDPVTEGQKQFMRLGMTRTKRRNGVLIYFAPMSQKFSVIGDEGIHRECGQVFWEHLTNRMSPMLAAHRFTEAILAGIEEVGTALAKAFPYESGDKNELPNKVARDPEK